MTADERRNLAHIARTEQRLAAVMRDNQRLCAALVRLLWIAIADDASCTCERGDVCPLCEATRALGLGRWRGARWAQQVLSAPGGKAPSPPTASKIRAVLADTARRAAADQKKTRRRRWL